MKIQGAKKVHYDSGPNMTPLVDVVMVILIFLMLTGTFAGATHYLKANLPPVEQSRETVASPIESDLLVPIRVDASQSNFFARTDRFSAVTDAKELTGKLKAMKQELNDAGKADDKIQIAIMPTVNVQYKFLVEVYVAAMDAGFTKIAFGTAQR